MGTFPKDASRARVVTALEALGLQVVREHEHIATVQSPFPRRIIRPNSPRFTLKPGVSDCEAENSTPAIAADHSMAGGDCLRG